MTLHQTTPRSAFVRVGDSERDRTLSLLAEHYAAGRLTIGEFHDRTSAAVSARRQGELDALVRDLPHVGEPAAALPVALGTAVPPPVRQASVFLAEVGLALLGLLAAFCLLVVFGATASGSGGFFLFLGALGGGTVAAAAVHFAHRLAGPSSAAASRQTGPVRR